jgi:transposase
LEYLGTSESLLQRLQLESQFSIKSYAHGDTRALLDAAIELDIVKIINKHIAGKRGNVQTRHNLTVGLSILLAAIGRACHPTSKMGWYNWCKETSLEYCLRSSFKDLDSQHFWDQMDAFPIEAIPKIEEEIVLQLIEKYSINPDCLFFDTTNFFSFIDSTNSHCTIAQRGKNKQKRTDLRQIGMALLVTREEQLPLFHKTYQGNKNDMTVFKEVFDNLRDRLKAITHELADITLVFDKGNNSKENFKKLDQEEKYYYVAGLVPSYFKELIREANKNFSSLKIANEKVPVYRIKQEVWNKVRTCVVTVSSQLKEGQLRGIDQHLAKKYKTLQKFKVTLENPKRKINYSREEIISRLQKTIRGQFIDEILKYDILEYQDNSLSFRYYIDEDAFEKIKEEILGRQIVVTNRHEWSSEKILLTYRGQSNVENAFRNLKNPHHLAVRPQYHWTDQKIEVHFLICILSYLLTMTIYSKLKKEIDYKHSIRRLMDDLKSIRIACVAKKKSRKVSYQLEKIPTHIEKLCRALNITNKNIRPDLKVFQ